MAKDQQSELLRNELKSLPDTSKEALKSSNDKSKAELDKLRSKAESICQQRNVRLTPQRLEVLRLMAKQQAAISAYDLLDLLRASEPQAKPPTVYRALDFLLEQRFIHRVESTNSYVMCHHIEEHSHTSALFICDRCGQVAERQTEGIKFILQQLALCANFTLRHSVVEAHGLCEACQKVADCREQGHCHHDHSVPIKNAKPSR